MSEHKLTAVPAAGEVARSEAVDPEVEALAALDRDDPEETLRILMEAYGTRLYRYCVQMVGDDDLAADVHQLTFVQAYQGLRRFRRQSALRTWLYGIARHRSLDAVKTRRRRERRIQLVEDLPEPADGAVSSEDRLSLRSMSAVLERCLGELAPRIRNAVLLRFQEGLSYPEIARLSDERAPTLQARVSRAMPVLRRCLERQGVTL